MPNTENATTETTTVTETTTTVGPIGRFFSAMKNNPWTTIGALGTIAGGSFFAYTRMTDGDLEGAGEEAAEVAGAVASLFG